MPRPKFLNCVMTAGVIRRIREAQAIYDIDPERWEREEQRRKEERQDERDRDFESEDLRGYRGDDCDG